MLFCTLSGFLSVQIPISTINQNLCNDKCQHIGHQHGIRHAVKAEELGQQQCRPTLNTSSRVMEMTVEAKVLPIACKNRNRLY